MSILAIGEAMVELSTAGDLRYVQSFDKSYGGDALNTAIALSRLGADVGFVSCIGNDPFSDGLRELLIRENVDTTAVKFRPGQTGLYFAAVDGRGQRNFVYYRQNSAASMLSPDDITCQLIQKANIVFATGVTLSLSENTRKSVIKAFKMARENNIITAFDPNYRESLWRNQAAALDAYMEVLPLVDIILPSCPEDTEKLVGFNQPHQVLDYFLLKGVKIVVVKAAQDGAYVGMDNQRAHVPAMNTNCVDSTGAGDAFNAGFLHGILNGQSLLDCVKIGNTVAGLKIQNRGTVKVMPYHDAVMAAMNNTGAEALLV